MAGHFCLKVLPILCVGLLLTACANKDLSFNPYTTVLNKVIKTQYINNKGE